jgi:branched-chain amino acid transport system permease protein
LFGGVKKPNVLQMIVITIGLSIVIREIALHLWGEQVKTLPYFSGSEVSSISVLGAHFSPQLLWVLGISALAVLALTLFFRFTLTGQAMRGVSDNPDGARLCGINPNFMVNLAFVLSAAIGALAGCVTAPITQTHYAVGTELAIKGFTVAIFGGLGNSLAAVAAGLCLGLLESFSIIVFPEAYKNIVTIGILLAVLFLKPSGLFGSKSKAGLKEF